MAEIALRSYNQEIQDLIDHGHLDEAIAHCQHILARYPKHVETYRLLGKCFLEQSRHVDAANIFQRVLSALPDDFLSHVAMAIMREDSGSLDSAIWHMERAYEVNPSNPTVQQEVRRLRGRRDGVEPARLRLTRGALARMYIKGSFFAQAAAEIRAALEEDPERADLQVLLATALTQGGQPAEAADVCNKLLEKLPYCLEANQILGQILWRMGRKPEAQEVFRRLAALDPYRGVRPPAEDGRLQDAGANAVTLSRLSWEPGAQPSKAPPPGWAEGLPLGATPPGEGEPGTPLPSWLEAVPQAHQAPFTQEEEAAGLQTPEWLSDASPALAIPAEGAGALLGPEEPESALTQAAEELPDWLRQPSAPAAPESKDTTPDWLKPESELEAEKQTPVPDWLTSVEQDAGLSVPGEGLPGWSKPEETQGEGIEPAQPAEQLPEWLKAEAPPGEESQPVQEFPELSTEAPKPDTGEPSVKGLDWLKPQEPHEAGLPPFESEAGPPADLTSAQAGESSASGPDWLREGTQPPFPEDKGPGAFAGFPWPARGETPQAESGRPPTEAPGWLKEEESAKLWREGGGGSEPEVEPPTTPATPVPAEGIPEWLKGPTAPGAGPSIEVPDWLKAEAAGPAEEAPPAPSWLTSDVFGPPQPPSGAGAEWLAPAQPAGAEEMPEWLKTGPIPAAVPPAEAAGPEAPGQPSSPELPDWLKADAGGPPGGGEAEAAPAIEGVPGSPGEAPSWLVELAGQAPPEPALEHEPQTGELPSWLDVKQPGASDTISRWLGQNIGAAAPGESAAPEISELPEWMRPSQAEAGPAGEPAEEEEAEEREPEAEQPETWLAAVEAGGPAPSAGEMPAPDWLQAALGQAATEITTVFPGAGPGSEVQATPAEPGQSRPAAEPAAVPTPQPEAPRPTVPPSPPAAAPSAFPAGPSASELGAKPAEVGRAPEARRPQEPMTAPPLVPFAPPTPTHPITPPIRVPPPVVPAPPLPSPAEESAPVAGAEPGRWVPLEAAAPPPSPAPAATAPAPTPAPRPRKAAQARRVRMSREQGEAALQEARSLFEIGHAEDALKGYLRVIEADLLAGAVADDAERVVEKLPDSAQWWQLLGDACNRAGRLQRAYQAYEKALLLM